MKSAAQLLLSLLALLSFSSAQALVLPSGMSDDMQLVVKQTTGREVAEQPAQNRLQELAAVRILESQGERKEQELLDALNTFRATGRIAGNAHAYKGTCADRPGRIGSLPALVRDRALDAASRLHALYMGRVEYAGYEQRPNSPLFVGQDPASRVKVAQSVIGGSAKVGAYQVNITKPSATTALEAWVKNPAQCEVIMSAYTVVGIGYDAGDPNNTGFDITGKRAVKRDAWMVIWGSGTPLMASR